MKLMLSNVKREKITLKELRYAINYMSELLMGSFKNKLNIDLMFDPNLKKVSEEGNCIYQDDNVSPKFFLINIKPGMSKKKILHAVAHELVHVKQFAKNELTSHNNEFATYNGKKYFYKTTDYWDTPWEIEALGREIGLVVRYKDHLAANSITF